MKRPTLRERICLWPRAIANRVKHAICRRITGHASALTKREPGRVYLECDCGWQSAGWTVNKPKRSRKARARVGAVVSLGAWGRRGAA